jgi:hypothetical protein
VALFQKSDGGRNGGGRRQGARNRISTAFLQALASDFQEHGEEAIKIMRIERPSEYVKVIASVLPKEFEISHSSQLTELDDVELEQFINRLRDELRRSVVADVGGGEAKTINGESTRLLQALPETG